MTHNNPEERSVEVEEILEEFGEKAYYWGYTSGDAIERLKSFWRDTLHHQLQKARDQEKIRIKTLLEDLPAFTPCSDKTMGKVADEAKKPAYLTNYIERETALKLLVE